MANTDTDDDTNTDTDVPSPQGTTTIESQLTVPPNLWPSRCHITRHSYRDSPEHLTTIHVGNTEQNGVYNPAATYTVLTNLLLRVSPYFAALLQPALKMGWEREIKLKDQTPETFDWFVWWMHTGSLTEPSDSCPDPHMSAYDCFLQKRRDSLSHSNKEHSDTKAPDSEPEPQVLPPRHADGDLRNRSGIPRYFLLFEIYALSDLLMATSLSNHVLDTIARLSEETNSVPTPADTHILYSLPSNDDSTTTTNTTTPSTAKLKNLVLDLFAFKKTASLVLSHPDEWEPRFMSEVFARLQCPPADTLDRHPVVNRVVVRIHAGAGVGCWACGAFVGATSARGKRERDARVEVATRHGICRLGPGKVLRCEGCGGLWCAGCVERGELGGIVKQGLGKRYADVGACKPWLGTGYYARGFCLRYHLH